MNMVNAQAATEISACNLVDSNSKLDKLSCRDTIQNMTLRVKRISGLQYGTTN
jgi:hypothetical protein